MKKVIFLLSLACFAGIAGCTEKNDGNSGADADSIHTVVEGNTDFALALYEKLMPFPVIQFRVFEKFITLLQ